MYIISILAFCNFLKFRIFVTAYLTDELAETYSKIAR